MQITFNTGRLYTAEGQIITARYDAQDEKIYFTDHSRMIADQMIDHPDDHWRPMTELRLAETVMKAYDHGRYTYAPWEKKVVRDETKAPLYFRL